MSENEKQTNQDRDDLNHEMAGIDAGRIARFLSQEARDYIEEGKNGKNDKKLEKLSLLDILLMMDPVYSQLYCDVMEKIEEIDRAVNEALAQTERRIGYLEENLADIKERAQRLSDGTLIYKSRDGTVYTDDGVSLSRQELGDVRWAASDPSWEERRETGEALDFAYREKEEIEDYRDNTLQSAKNRMSDNLPDKDDLEDIIGSLDQGLPMRVQDNIRVSNDVEKQSDLETHFQSKASGQDETPDETDSINQPTTQETAPSQNRSDVVAP